MKKIFVISDTHFNHVKKMMKYCNRPFNYEALLWDNLFSLPEDSVLIHLGDVCIGKDSEVHEMISALKCRKILVLGNHDYKSKAWYMDHGWDFACDMFSWELHRKTIVFTHKPVAVADNAINIHGHFHNATPKIIAEVEDGRDKDLLGILSSKHKLVACELTNYKPVLLDKIING